MKPKTRKPAKKSAKKLTQAQRAKIIGDAIRNSDVAPTLNAKAYRSALKLSLRLHFKCSRPDDHNDTEMSLLALLVRIAAT